nr:hypothetical protein [Tanacetum cinerariifolium]
MMKEVKAFNSHPAHEALYDALAVLLSIDKDEMDRIFGKSRQTKRRRDDHDKDPFPNADKDSKKRQKKLNSSKNDKDQARTSKQGKSSSKPSKSNKAVDADETEWFKKSPRPATPKTPDSDWSKDQNADTGPEQKWFPELKKTTKAPEDFDDVLGSTFDFSNFIKYHLKNDTLTKSDLEGPVFKLFKGSYKSCINLNTTWSSVIWPFLDKLDWINLEGDRTHQDFSKPIPLFIAHGQQYIPAKFFFNKDLEYLRSGNLKERKYTTLFTKTKATRYELYGIEEMIQSLWSLYKVAYDKDVAFRISHGGLKQKLFYRARQAKQSDHIVYSLIKILSIVKIAVEEYSGYGYLKEIVVNKEIQKEYVFKEADFLSLHLNDIEDNVPSVLPKQTLPPRRPYSDPLGCCTLVFHSKNYVPIRPWSDKDKRRIESMVKVIKKTLHKRWIIMSLEYYVGERKHEVNYRLLTQTD